MCRIVLIAAIILFRSTAHAAPEQQIIDEIMLHVFEKCYKEAAETVIAEQGLAEFGITVEEFLSMMMEMNAAEIEQAIQQVIPVISNLETLEQRLAFYEATRKICVANQTK